MSIIPIETQHSHTNLSNHASNLRNPHQMLHFRSPCCFLSFFIFHLFWALLSPAHLSLEFLILLRCSSGPLCHVACLDIRTPHFFQGSAAWAEPSKSAAPCRRQGAERASFFTTVPHNSESHSLRPSRRTRITLHALPPSNVNNS